MKIFLALYLLASTPLMANEQVSSCLGKIIASPLVKSLRVLSAFNPSSHFGTDYESNGESIIAVDDAEVTQIGWDLRLLSMANKRTGLKTQGWGRYVILRHSNGSESLYAHLEKESVKHLRTGMKVARGELLGRSDSTGAVTAPHLHFEYSPSGSVLLRSNKQDGNQCIARTGTVSFESLTPLHGGDFELSLDGKRLGNTGIGMKKQFTIAITPGRHELTAKLVKAIEGKRGGYNLELSEAFEVVNKDGDIMSAGDSQHDILEGSSRSIFIDVFKNGR
jgi:murein DD-endopeptidase MepM/ murein hydrolase activator NlpD